MDWTKTTARRDENHLSLGIWCTLYQRFDGISQDLLLKYSGINLQLNLNIAVINDSVVVVNGMVCFP